MEFVLQSAIIFLLVFSSIFTTISPIEGRLGGIRFKEFDEIENTKLGSGSQKLAHLLVQKRLRNKFVVEGLDLVVEYTLYNVGSIAATHVHLKDVSFEDETNFVRVSGLTDVNLGKILAGENISHAVVLRPLNRGTYNFSGAEITYSSGAEEQEEDTFGTSSEPGSVLIHSSVAFHRTYSPHYEEWTAFAVLVLPSLLIPYMLWLASQSKYENLDMVRENEKMRRVTHSQCRRD